MGRKVTKNKLPELTDEITISDLVLDSICGVTTIVILDVCFQKYIQLIFDFALKFGG